jgi:membrane protease YdiL (CAAX protease family)
MIGERSQRVAYLAPFLSFLGFLLLAQVVAKFGDGYANWLVAQPNYWVFPLQTVTCGAIVWRFRRLITFGPPAGFAFATFIGLIALGIWISPQEGWRLIEGAQRLFSIHLSASPRDLVSFPPRTDGFQPAFFANDGWPYWANLTMRLIRMGIVVPLVEEIFWRGFLLRFLIDDHFSKVPFGTFTWRSFLISSFAFCLEHQFSDWPAAIVTGALFNLVAYRTRSLAACVVTHAVTNLALAAYILQTGQWGFW